MNFPPPCVKHLNTGSFHQFRPDCANQIDVVVESNGKIEGEQGGDPEQFFRISSLDLVGLQIHQLHWID